MIKKINLYFSIHYSFILLFVLSLLFNLFWVFVSYFICLVLHELVHAVVAKRLGYKIGKIKLAATGATLEAESDEFGFSEEIKIAISAIKAIWYIGSVVITPLSLVSPFFSTSLPLKVVP